MKYYSDYSQKYVQDICNELNRTIGSMEKDVVKEFAPEHFESLSYFIRQWVVGYRNLYEHLDSVGLVNRGRCPYTGQKIDSTFPNWHYFKRKIYLSHEGLEIMKKESDDEYGKLTEQTAPFRSKTTKPSGCYIATVCYGNEFSEEVLFLKKYRDEVLSKSTLGLLFIKTYYFLSPTIANFLADKSKLNNLIRKHVLDVIIAKLNK